MKMPLPQLGTLAIVTASLMTANLALADSELWIGNPGVTTTTNWSDTANWSGPSHNPNNNDVFFGNGVAVSQLGLVNNVVDLSTNCYSLNYTNSTGFNTTLIADGQTLTIIGNHSGPGLSLIPNAQVSQTNTITGANGKLLITGSSAGGVTVTVTNSGATGQKPLLDLSGLGTLIISNASSTAAINVGNSASRPGGTLNLAMTNIISLAATGTGGSAAIVVGEATSNNGSSPGGVLNLGVSNAIFAGNIGVGLSKQSAGTVAFNSSFLANNPVAYIRGPGGSAVTNWAIGDGINTSGTSTGPGGTVNFNGGTVNAVVSAMWLGKPSQTSATAPTAKGTLSFSAGTIGVVNLTNGCAVPPTTGGPGAATGTINVSGTGTLAVNNLVLAFLGSGAASSTATLNVTNGTVAAGTIVAGGGSSTINLVGGTLYLTNTAGTALAPLSSLYVSNATMQVSISGSSAPSVVATLYPDGTTNIINIASMPGVATFPMQFPVIAYSSLASTFNFGLGTLPGSYQGYISNNAPNSSVDLVVTGSALKTDIWNGNVNGNWDTSTLNWLYSGGAVGYQQGDFVTFDDTLSGTPNVTLTLNVAPGALGFNNSSHNYVLSGAFKITGATGLTKQGSGSVRLSESGGDDFSGGITVNNGTLILDNANSAINGGLAINGGTAQIGSNDANGALPAGTVAVNDGGVLAFNRTDSVAVATAITGSGSLVQQGSGTLTLSGGNAYTGNTTVSAGTLALGGSGTISNSTAVSVNHATFDVLALSQPAALNSLTLSGANINVVPSGSAAANIACASLAFGPSPDHINVVSLPPIASYPVTFTIIQSASAASGTFSFDSPTLPGGYAANVTQSGDGMAVLLTVTSGPIGVRPVVFWTGADAPNLNWSDRLNWQLPGAPTASDYVIFDDVAAISYSPFSAVGAGPGGIVNPGAINNIVDSSSTISVLNYSNILADYQNTSLPDGVALNIVSTNTRPFTVGSASSDYGASAQGFVTIAGTNGTFNLDDTNGTIFVGLGSGNSGSHQATLDLSGLGTFNASISRLLVGAGSSSVGISEARESGVIYLAQTNTITASLAVSGTETSDTSASAAALDIGDNDGNGGNTSYLYLGQTNAIFAGAICTARQKQSGQMLFNSAFTGPSAWFRGANGVSAVGTWSLGDGVVNAGSSGSTGVNDFSGGKVNALVNTMYVGRAANTTSGSGTSIGTLTFDDGVVNVSTLYIGYQPTNSAKAGVGTVNVSSNATAGAGATLVVTGNLNLGVSTGGTGAASTSGTLNLTNGTVQAFNIVPGANSTINVAGGWLVLTNPLGNATAPLGTLTLASLGTPDNSATLLSLPARTNSAGITVTALNLDGLDTTTNVINIESVGPVGAVPVELPLIKYGSLNLLSGGTFNVGLGTLPSGYTGYLTNDTTIDPAIALVLTTALHPQPRITAFSLQSATNLTVSGVNGFANVTYSVVASTNVALPLANWTSVGTGIFGPDGSFSFAASVTAVPQQFFRLQAP